jgi:glycosidase
MRPTPIAQVLLLFSACSSSGSSSPDAGLLHVASPVWQEQIIYFVMTDRFADGDRTNDDQHAGEYDPTDLNRYSGGDLQGVIDKLDYIQGLGATAVWITPPVANMWWDPLQQSGGYHGYWARDLKKVDEHEGTLATYKALSDALHRRGMYLIQDIVPNHMGNFFQYSSYDPADPTQGFVKNVNAVPTSKPDQTPFDEDDVTDPAQRAAAIYHFTPAIADYGDPNQEVNYQVSDLDDLNTENPVVRKALRDSYGYWIKEVGVDAFRVDTAKFVPHEFWHDFFYAADADAPGMMAVAKATGRERFLAFGEVFEVPDAMTDTLEKKVASFLGTPDKPELPSVLAFPLYGDIERLFATGQPTADMTYRLGRMMDPTLYPDPYVLPTFIDNHDVRRFLSISTGPDMLMALELLFTIPGIPVVYYGTEQLFTETRQAMFKGGYRAPADAYVTDGLYYQRIKKLADMRKASPALTHGGLDVLYDNANGPGAFAYRRTQGTETVLVLMNTSTQPALVAQMDAKLPAGSTFTMLHSEQSPPDPVVGQGGLLTAVLPPKSVIIARATGQTTTPPTPAATITVATPIAGQTFTKNVTFAGTVSPATTRLVMVLDGNVYKATPVTVGGDGGWSVALPVSDFASGVFLHDVAFYAPDASVATVSSRFTTDVKFNGKVIDVDDPVGDDKGPKGTYTYPTDQTFQHQMDITHVNVEVGATTMNLHLTMKDFTSLWSPQNGFDHVYFNIYFSLPGKTGATVMPKLHAQVPASFTWSYSQFSGGFNNAMYTSDGATADGYGAVARAPTLSVSPATKTISFTYDRNNFGLASWSGVKIYIATWDFDGIQAIFRPLTQDGGQWVMGGGGDADPMIMDDMPPITLE